MKLEDIFKLWEEDCNIDRQDLGTESLKISKLHSKYYSIYVQERLRLRKYEAEMKTLKLEKYEFYTQGPTREQMDKGWQLPACGRIIKSEVSSYMDADKDMINLSLQIGIQQEKIELLESIIKSLSNRGYNIRAAIDWAKFQSGM